MDVSERDGSFQLEWLLGVGTLDFWSSFDDSENRASDFGCPNNLGDAWNDQQDLRKGNDHRNIHSQYFFDPILFVSGRVDNTNLDKVGCQIGCVQEESQNEDPEYPVSQSALHICCCGYLLDGTSSFIILLDNGLLLGIPYDYSVASEVLQSELCKLVTGLHLSEHGGFWHVSNDHHNDEHKGNINGRYQEVNGPLPQRNGHATNTASSRLEELPHSAADSSGDFAEVPINIISNITGAMLFEVSEFLF